ncbi:hypothetical protein [Arenibaculum pallidiluteum]|uniref:hypothetical protein n=1 Tax=Arenibaculum pallidiluteum TaxID=2812559 RepID=UPI001A9574A2|nr:hypothetical protein [Arenibaculum pallidiluteum]
MKHHPNYRFSARMAAAAAGALLTAACGTFRPAEAPAGRAGAGFVERVADGAYDIGIRYPSRRSRYVMNVEDDGEVLSVTMSPVATATDPGPHATAAPPADLQQADRVVERCRPDAGNWYRHTPLGYVCVAQVTPVAGISGSVR